MPDILRYCHAGLWQDCQTFLWQLCTKILIAQICIFGKILDFDIYPVVSFSIYVADILFCGMSPLVIVIYLIFFCPYLCTPIFTFSVLRTFQFVHGFFLGNLLPTNVLPSTLTILSPAKTPALSAGPFLITFWTCMVSWRIVNSTPIPEKELFSSSFVFCTSLALIYTECGSSSARICGIAFSPDCPYPQDLHIDHR